MNIIKTINKVLRFLFLIPVYLYKICISPFLGQSCRYSPTCSTYMVEAVKRFGIFRGFLLGISRILRCNRLFYGGPDEVPEKFSFKAIKNGYIIYHKTKKKPN